jgi:hypothetical protein
MWKFAATCLFFICTGSFAQNTREEWSKAIKDSNQTIENILPDIVRGMNKSKGNMTDAMTLSLGATAANRIIVSSHQLTKNEFTSGEALKAKEKMYKQAITGTCAMPLMFVLLHEYDVKINYRYFDKNMKEVIEFVVEKNGCK